MHTCELWRTEEHEVEMVWCGGSDVAIARAGEVIVLAMSDSECEVAH